jgi:hypothetical protein
MKHILDRIVRKYTKVAQKLENDKHWGPAEEQFFSLVMNLGQQSADAVAEYAGFCCRLVVQDHIKKTLGSKVEVFDSVKGFLTDLALENDPDLYQSRLSSLSSKVIC